METIKEFLFSIQDVLTTPLFSLGNRPLSAWTFIYIILLLAILIFLTGKLRRWLTNTLLAKSSLDIGIRQSIGTISRYVILTLGFVVIMQTAGIDLSAIKIMAGALGIGIGFGLQNVTNNFVSGLIILFERPIKVGDRIEVGSVTGEVIKISARATTVLTNDNIAIIVPNSEFISSKVTNWSHNDNNVRFKVPVDVAYGSDVRKVEKILLEVAKDDSDVLTVPPPAVRFISFGDNGLHFELRAWSSTLIQRPGKLISQLNFAIYKKFEEHKIDIPFPQRDMHIKSGILNIEQNKTDKA